MVVVVVVVRTASAGGVAVYPVNTRKKVHIPKIPGIFPNNLRIRIRCKQTKIIYQFPGRSPIQDPVGFNRILQKPIGSCRILLGS